MSLPFDYQWIEFSIVNYKNCNAKAIQSMGLYSTNWIAMAMDFIHCIITVDYRPGWIRLNAKSDNKRQLVFKYKRAFDNAIDYIYIYLKRQWRFSVLADSVEFRLI